MKKIALVVVLAAALIYFLVKRTAGAAKVREEAILNSIPQNAFEGPTVDGGMTYALPTGGASGLVNYIKNGPGPNLTK